jgi:hypothetical protein
MRESSHDWRDGSELVVQIKREFLWPRPVSAPMSDRAIEHVMLITSSCFNERQAQDYHVEYPAYVGLRSWVVIRGDFRMKMGRVRSGRNRRPLAKAVIMLTAVQVAGVHVSRDANAASIPWHGWSSGASGEDVAKGAFEAWRGSPVTVAGTWCNTTFTVQADLYTVAVEYGLWNGDMDIAVGGTELNNTGQTYAQAAAGQFDSWWIEQGKSLKRTRGDKAGLTFVRPFHEFNGGWYVNWFVTPDNVNDYKNAFRRLVGILRQEFPRVVIVWSPTSESSHGAAPIADAYPGDDVVDVIGADAYNGNGSDPVTDAAKWDTFANRGTAEQPVGPEKWRLFAEHHGKPLALSEWGLHDGIGGGDTPAYVQGTHDWISSHAAQPGDSNVAGKIVYDIYFNAAFQSNRGYLIKAGTNVNSGRLYQSLAWGNSQYAPWAAQTDVAAAPPPTATPVPTTTTIPTTTPVPTLSPTPTPAPTIVSTPTVNATTDAQPAAGQSTVTPEPTKAPRPNSPTRRARRFSRISAGAAAKRTP